MDSGVSWVVAPTDVVERDQVGVSEPCDGLGLADDLPFLLRDPARADDLERHLPAQVPVLRLVDHAEAAAPQLAQDLEAADDGTWKERSRLDLTLLRRLGQLPEKVGQRAGLHARRRNAAVPDIRDHADPL